MGKQVDEFTYINWVRNHTAGAGQLGLGIGDDTAILNHDPNQQTLVTVDMLMDGVHFLSSQVTPERIGHKALAVNLSDIAAMGGRPTSAVVSVCFSRYGEKDFPKRFHAGLQKLADEYDVKIVGGDTNTWNGPFVVSVTVMGTVETGTAKLRSGAQPGDAILVTGELGGSRSGHHLDFIPRVREALEIVNRVEVNAMMDISDGLAADLHHILDASSESATGLKKKQARRGARIYADRIPIRQAAHDQVTEEQKSGVMSTHFTALNHALADGEDFELLLTLPPEQAQKLLDSTEIEFPLTQIGEITDDGHCQLVFENGKTRELPSLGWKHGW